jgi:hypothetical protein
VKNIKTAGMTITIGREKFTVDALPIVSRSVETELKQGRPDWRGPVYTPGTSWRFRAMTDDSLKVYAGNRILKKKRDYLVDYDWGTVGAVKKGSGYWKCCQSQGYE